MALTVAKTKNVVIKITKSLLLELFLSKHASLLTSSSFMFFMTCMFPKK